MAKKTTKSKKNNKKQTNKNWKKVLYIVILLIGLFFIFYLVDMTRALKDDKTPIFSIKTGEFSDGVSTEYTGIGYKIIYYRQENGRYDTKIGTWAMKFIDKPTKLNILDLAIEYTDNPVKTYKKYKGEYIEITSKPYYIDEKNNVIRFQYNDVDKKYTFATDFYLMYQPAILYKDKEITVVGTVDNFRNKSKDTSKALTIKNAFVKE